MVDRRRKAKKTKANPKGNKAPFRYTRGAPDPYHSLLNFIQTQAHNNQVESLVKQLSQAQAHAKNARREAFEEAYANVRPMDEDPPTPPNEPENMEIDRPSAVRLRRGRNFATQTTQPTVQSHGTQTSRSTSTHGVQTEHLATLSEDMASHIAHTVEPAVAREVFRFAASGEAKRAPEIVELSHPAFFFRRMNNLARRSEHGGIPTPEGIAAYKQAVLEMRSRDDAARSGYLPFARVTTGHDYVPTGRDFKAARVNDPSAGADLQAAYGSYLDSRLRPRD